MQENQSKLFKENPLEHSISQIAASEQRKDISLLNQSQNTGINESSIMNNYQSSINDRSQIE